MKKLTRKIFISSLLAFSAFMGAGCANRSNSDDGVGITLASNKLWLNRYEEKYLEFLEGDGTGLTYSVADSSIVTVDADGKFIAKGTGDTEVTIKSSTGETTITVTVRDDGTLPMIMMKDENDICAYKDVETTLPIYIEYGGMEYDIENYSLSVSGTAADYLSVNGNKITGKQLTGEGETARITVSCSYKGLTLEEIFRLSVLESSYIDMGKDTFDLYYGETTLSAVSIVPVKAIYKGQTIAAEDLSVEIVDGADKVEAVKNAASGITQIKAKAYEGTATITIFYASSNGERVEQPMTVALHPAYIETSFSLYDKTKGAIYEEVDETSDTELFSGRDGVMKYVADPVSQAELIEAGTTSPNKATLQISTDRSFEERRLMVAESDEVLVDLYRKGYRYFSYDVYIETTASEGALPAMPLCKYYGELDRSFNELFYQSGVYIVQNGQVTNRLAKNGWMTVVFDLYSFATSSTAKANFYFALNDKLATAYIDNVRFHLDGEFIPDNGVLGAQAILSYEKQADGSTSVSGGCEFIPYYSNDFSVEVPSDYILSSIAEADDTHEDAYLLTAISSAGRWNCSAILASSMASNYYEGITRLRALGDYVAFDMYVASAEGVEFRMNHSLTRILLSSDSDISDSPYITILDKTTGKKCKTFEYGVWQTVVLHYDAAVISSGWGSNIAIGITNKSGKVLIDNVRYLSEFTLPTEVEGSEESIRSQFEQTVTVGADVWAEYYEESDSVVLKYSHNLPRNSSWANIGVQFKVKDNIGENNYVKLSFKYEDCIVNSTTAKPNIFIFTGANISQTEWSAKGVYVYNSIGSPVSYGDLVAGEWYDMYIAISNKTQADNQYYICFYYATKAEETDFPLVTAYFKDVTFEAENTLAGEYADLMEKVGTGSNVTATYYIDDEGDAAVKLENKVPMGDGNGWAKSALTFTSTDMTAGTYLTFQFKFDALASGENPIIGANKFGGACKTNIFSENWYGNADACVIYTSDGTKITAATDLKAGTWYTMYAYIPTVADDIYISFYDSNGTTATGYIKNVELNVASLP